MRLLLLFVLAFLAVGCSNNTAAPVDENTAQVKVTTDGKLFLNGAETTLDDLKVEFTRLQASGGGVQYYRENPAGEPHPITEQVMQAVIEAQLPIQLMEQDFG
jgi:PBP1b-binding outer membrane lipoprotein LpoB